jgi:CubicO group peptidase (beta-lactamase class C family)
MAKASSFSREELIAKFAAIPKLQHTVVGAASPSKGFKIVCPEPSQDENLDENTQFFIGSVSKQFTAFMALKALHEKNQDKAEGVAHDLHAPLSQILKGSPLLAQMMDFTKHPDFAGTKPANWLDTTTIHELLSHTSGLERFDEYAAATKDSGQAAAAAKATPLDHIEALQSAKFLGKKDYVYVNTNYLLAAKIIEQLTGVSFTAYAKQLTEGFGLESTLNVESGTFAEAKEKCCPKLDLKPEEPLIDDLHNDCGGGAMVSTVHDLLKWGATLALHPYHKLMSQKVVKSSAVHDYGYGVATEATELCGDIISHNGIIGSYFSYLFYWPSLDVHMAVLSCDKEELEGVTGALSNLFDD